MTAVLTLLSFTSAIASFMLWAEFHAPQGYEDDEGFHLGTEPRSSR